MSATRQLLPRLQSLRPRSPTSRVTTAAAARSLQTTPRAHAVLLPITAHGPPPQPPQPVGSRISELLERQKAAALKSKKFWKEVHVVESPDGFTIALDTRVLKTPRKQPLLIPRTKPLLADGIALEWSHLRRVADATATHRLPLTQLASRALDTAAAEAAGDFTTRRSIVENLIRYANTDTALCLAPSSPSSQKALRREQEAVAGPLLEYLERRVWPGVKIRVMDGDLGMVGGGGQSTETREALRRWVEGLDVWRLVGFERVVHATKSFVIGARMVAEWGAGGERQWGVEEAGNAAGLEVAFQTRQWGEVEDTHDVGKEDMSRQLGGGWLMICGEV